jgi:hypothetical protein
MTRADVGIDIAPPAEGESEDEELWMDMDEFGVHTALHGGDNARRKQITETAHGSRRTRR